MTILCGSLSADFETVAQYLQGVQADLTFFFLQPSSSGLKPPGQSQLARPARPHNRSNTIHTPGSTSRPKVESRIDCKPSKCDALGPNNKGFISAFVSSKTLQIKRNAILSITNQ